MSSEKQLFSIIKQMQLVDYYNALNNKVVLRDADDMPFIRLPNGLPCLVANAYMIVLYKKGLSRRNRGGTLRQYAADISHLIRYCYQNNLDFIQMDRNRFTHFMNGLRAQKDEINPEVKKRDSNTLNAIGRKCLDFLDFVGKLNDEVNFVDNTIHGYKKTFYIKAENTRAGFIETQSWHHESFDTSSPQRKRGPISTEIIAALYDTIPLLSENARTKQEKNFLDRRRVTMLRQLEMTGARIGEVANIQVDDIEYAIQQQNPKLRLITFKNKSRSERFVPVMRQDLAAIKSYIRVYRSRVIKQKLGFNNDHGYLFVCGKTGRPLSSRTMSNEVGLLRRASGISSAACAHMFRHRFITKLFVRLIDQYDYETKDEFRRALLDTNMLKQEVQQYTGHKVLGSLDHYIDLAFDEVGNLSSVVNKVNLQNAYQAFDENVEQLHRELASGMSVEMYLKKYRELKDLRLDDVERFS